MENCMLQVGPFAQMRGWNASSTRLPGSRTLASMNSNASVVGVADNLFAKLVLPDLYLPSKGSQGPQNDRRTHRKI